MNYSSPTPTAQAQAQAQTDCHNETILVEALTPREVEYIRLWLNPAMSREDAANILGITTHTAKRHGDNVMSKLGCSRMREAIAKFVKLNPQYLSEVINFYLPQSHSQSQSQSNN